jgi:hypothetical protein
MSHHDATFQSVFDKTATAYDFVCAMADRLYWLDNTYLCSALLCLGYASPS